MWSDPLAHSTFARANVEKKSNYHIGRYVARSRKIARTEFKGHSMQREMQTEVGVALGQGNPIMAALQARRQELYGHAIALVDEWWWDIWG